MKIRLFLALTLAALLVSPASARHCRSVRRVAVHCVGQVYAYQQAQYVAPAPVYVRPSPQAVAVPLGQVQGDDAGAFLAMLNQARAQVGRPALVFDAALASYAATNASIHMPGSSGGAGQCWAGCRSFTQAFHMWRNSPAHWSILMNATTSVGIAPCSTGITANAR